MAPFYCRAGILTTVIGDVFLLRSQHSRYAVAMTKVV